MATSRQRPHPPTDKSEKGGCTYGRWPDAHGMQVRLVPHRPRRIAVMHCVGLRAVSSIGFTAQGRYIAKLSMYCIPGSWKPSSTATKRVDKSAPCSTLFPSPSQQKHNLMIENEFRDLSMAVHPIIVVWQNILLLAGSYDAVSHGWNQPWCKALTSRHVSYLRLWLPQI